MLQTNNMDIAVEATNLVLVGSAVLTSICYSYFLSSTISKGAPRLLSLLPVFLLFAAIPLVFSSAILTGSISFLITWLANSKLLLFAFDQGPLSPSAYPPNKPLLLFAILACFPIKIKPPNSKTPKSNSRNPNSPLDILLKAVLLAISVQVYDRRHHLLRVHPYLLYVLYSCMLLLYVDVVVGFFVSTIGVILGYELERPSNQPYLSTSLQEFWGRRWNLIVTDTLRHTVRNPLRWALAPTFGPNCAQTVSLLGAFLVSGLAHELIYYYITRASPTWEVTWFFVLHGFCVTSEVMAKAAMARRFRLHRAVSTTLTLGFVCGTCVWLFYPPLIRKGMDHKAVAEYKYLVGSLKAFIEKAAKIVVAKYIN